MEGKTRSFLSLSIGGEKRRRERFQLAGIYAGLDENTKAMGRGIVAIYNANGNSHKYSGRGFNGLRYIPDTYAGNDACMQPVERRGEIIFFFRSFLPSLTPFSLCREREIRVGRRRFPSPCFFLYGFNSNFFLLEFGQF